MPSCSSCKAEIVWATMRDTKAMMPVDVATVEPHDVAASVVAVRRSDRLGVVLDAAAAMKVRAAPGSWSSWSFHPSHWETCPSSGEHRVNPNQEAML